MTQPRLRSYRLAAEGRAPVAGFTMLELMVSSVILLVMMGIVFQFTLRGQEMARLQTKESALRDQAMQIVENACDDIRQCGGNQTVPANPTGSDESVSFSKVVDLDDAGNLTYAGAALTYTLTLAAGETQNGNDDNGDGLIDELVLTRTSSDLDSAGDEIVTVIATGVKGWDTETDTNMFGFRLRRPASDERLRVSLTLQRYDTRSGRTLEQTYNSGVTFRN